ncbi:Unknown protein, partial [Striga hermonthica]
KLDQNNFLMWKQQALSAIKGYGLETFIKKEAESPSPIVTRDGSEETNPDFILWERQDQILASWILSSLTEGMLVLTVGLNSSKDIWLALENNFSAQSQAKVMQYKILMQSLKKNGMTMGEYISKMKSFCDILASAGHKISETDQVLHILSGLGNEYDSVMVNVTSRIEPYGLNELHALLLSYKARLEANNNLLGPTINTDGTQPSINATQMDNRRFNNPFNQGRGNFKNFRGSNFNRGGRFARGGRGRGRYNNNKVICQICNVANHTVDRCWYRSDLSYGNSGQQTQQGNVQRNPNLNLSHFGQIPQLGNSNNISEIGSESSWFPDSGATTNVTNELANLNMGSEYVGNNRLQMGNGAEVNISHIGNSFLRSPQSSKAFLLRNLLHVPSITKNLLSVSSFASDNNVYFEFHPSY